jgi:uncharacterized protein (TIGR04255 family)
VLAANPHSTETIGLPRFEQMVSVSLPKYDAAPVVEIVAAVQFAPLPRLDLPMIVEVAKIMDGWRVQETSLARDRIVEQENPSAAPETPGIIFGEPPQRVVLISEDGRWIAQLQSDRIAIHEKVHDAIPPSFGNVGPKLSWFAEQIEKALGLKVAADDHPADLVELTYLNEIPLDQVRGGVGDAHRVLRLIHHPAGGGDFSEVEQISTSFSYRLNAGTSFSGRLRVSLDPVLRDDGEIVILLRLFSRRLVVDDALGPILDTCHKDVVLGFSEITTDEMHRQWMRRE